MAEKRKPRLVIRAETLRSVAVHSSQQQRRLYTDVRGRFLIVPRRLLSRNSLLAPDGPEIGPLAFEDARETPE